MQPDDMFKATGAPVIESIYVAQGKGGLLKAGRTSDVEMRKKALRSEFRAKGDEMAVFSHFGPTTNGFCAEAHLLIALGQHLPLHSGREWFCGREFANAERAAAEIVKYINETFVQRRMRTAEEEACFDAACRLTLAKRVAERARKKAAGDVRRAGIVSRRKARVRRGMVCAVMVECLVREATV